MKLRVALLTILLSMPAHGQLPGCLTYLPRTGGVGKEHYVFGPDPSDPTKTMVGGDISDYSGRAKIEGADWWAQLWYAPGVGRADSELNSVPGSITEFQTGSVAGLYKGIAKLCIPGTLGGDHVTLQLRVWNNRGGTILTWEQALATQVASGKSNLMPDFILGGVESTGAPVLGDGSLQKYILNFGLAIPEPSLTAQVALVTIWILRVRRSRK